MKILKAVFKNFTWVLIFLLLTSCSKVKTVVFKNVNVIPMTSEIVLENRDVYVKGNQIDAIVPTGTDIQGQADIIIDGEGKYLIPGLADMHVHIYRNIEGSDLPLYIATGVTTIRDCNGREFILKFRDEVEKGKKAGPRIFCTTHTIRGLEEKPWKLVRERYEKGYDAVKFYSWFKSGEAFHKAMNEAKKINAYTIGHIPYKVGLDGIIEEGMNEIAHVEEIAWEFADIDKSLSMEANEWLRYIVGRFIQKYGDLPPPKMKDAIQLEAQQIVRKLKGEKITVSTTCHYTHNLEKKIFDIENYIMTPYLKYLPPDYYINVGLGREKHQRQFGEIAGLINVWKTMLATLLVNMHQEGILIVGGTDAIWDMGIVPGFSLHAELIYFVNIGLTPYEALRLCTANSGEAARRMKGLEKSEFGTLESGKRADLVLLDNNPLEDILYIRVNSGVMANGRWYSQEDCTALLYFDEKKHQDYLDVFKACRALIKNNEQLLDQFMQKTDYEDIKNSIYKHIDISTKMIEVMHKKYKTERVKEYFQEAVKSNWDNVNYLNTLSWRAGCEMKIAEIYPDAIRAVKRAIKLRKNAGIYDTLAWLYAFSGDYDKAINAINEAKRLDPENKAWDETREEILKIKSA